MKKANLFDAHMLKAIDFLDEKGFYIKTMQEKEKNLLISIPFSMFNK